MNIVSDPSRVLSRPYNLWQWESYGVGERSFHFPRQLTGFQTYIEFLAGLIAINTVLYLVLSHYRTYVDAIGLIALGLESTVVGPWSC